MTTLITPGIRREVESLAATARDRRMVPAPSNPMAVARDFVKATYTVSGECGLRHHRGDFYRWTGTCWPEIKQQDVRKAAYEFLEHARYYDPEEGLVPFAPTRRKIDDLMDALRAIVLLDSASEAPVWMSKISDLSAREIIPMANGLLHVHTRTLLPQTPTFFAHHALPFAFDPAASRPRRWLRFLVEL